MPLSGTNNKTCTTKQLTPNYINLKVHHHHLLPPWIRSFDLFRHRRVAVFSWGVHDIFSSEVCSWGRVSEVWCCPFFRDGWSSSVCIWISRLVFQRSLVFFYDFASWEVRSQTKKDKLVLHEWGFCGWACNPLKENKVLISKDHKFNWNNVQSRSTKPNRIHTISSPPSWFPKMARLWIPTRNIEHVKWPSARTVGLDYQIIL